MIEINTEGLDAIRDTFKRLVPEVKGQVLNGMAQVASLRRAAAGEYPHGHRRIGRFVDAPRPVGDSAWIIEHNLQVAPCAVCPLGTRAHEINALPFPFPVWYARTTKTGKKVPYLKKKRSLRWTAGAGGGTHYVFAMHVHHPGYKGDPWLVNAADEAVRQFDAIVRRVEGELAHA